MPFAVSAAWSVPGKQGRHHEVAFTHVVGDLELQMHGADLGGREDVCAVVAVAWRLLRCAGAPCFGRGGGEAPLCGVLADEPCRGVQAGGRELDCQPVRVAGAGRS